MKATLLKAVLLTTLIVLGFGCAAGKEPSEKPFVPTQAAQTSAKEPWEAEWGKVVATAKKEETVIVASSMSASLREALSKGLKDKFGVGVEVMIGRPAEFIPKIQAERRMGIYSMDVLVAGSSTIVSTLIPDGSLESLDQFLILPDFQDRSLWLEGQLKFVDQNHNLLGMTAIPKRPVAFNTDLVKAGEIQSYRDLLDPKWKGKILIADPTIGGSGNDTFQAIAEYIMDLNYLRELARQEPVILRDNRLMVEWLARGKYSILSGGKEEEISEFRAMGAPIAIMSPKEGTHATISGFGISVLKNAPHPAATKLFINWLLSKGGQQF